MEKLNRKLLEEVKLGFVAMPGGQIPSGADGQAAPSGGGGAPMDPNMMAGGGAPMDPNMMAGGGMPMDPSMMAGGGMPMDPSMMAGGGVSIDPSAVSNISPAADSSAVTSGQIILTPQEFVNIIATILGQAKKNTTEKETSKKTDKSYLKAKDLSVEEKVDRIISVLESLGVSI